jgi:F0F1-type ATP synthase alpha subunit
VFTVMALNLERDSVGAVVLGDYKSLAEGQSCRCTGRILEVPVGDPYSGAVSSMHSVTLSMARALLTPRPMRLKKSLPV